MRSSGILLHIASLPSRHGIGDMGDGAYSMAELLSAHNQSLWQVLPLVPVEQGQNYSPYSSTTAFAGNPLLISPRLLIDDGFIDSDDFSSGSSTSIIDYESATAYKSALLDRAWQRFSECGRPREFEEFCRNNEDWLDDYSLFRALRIRYGTCRWDQWPDSIRYREPRALAAVRHHESETVEREKFIQWVFYTQWGKLKRFCNERGVRLIGDIPFFVNFGSADVWAHPELFKLGSELTPTVVAGVPPDYFSSSGQLWGNPVYNWETMQREQFRWWVRRFQHCVSLYDLVRIDHFRGFCSSWEVPADETTALHGTWSPGPGHAIFHTLYKHLFHLPIIAEDLGTITAEVRELMRCFAVPGMRVLLFAFDARVGDNPYAPHNHTPECVVYVGNHDTNTVRGWFEQEASDQAKEILTEYTGRKCTPETVSEDLIRLSLMSVGCRTIIPMQDVLGLGSESRMNRPGSEGTHWRWRMTPDQLSSSSFETLGKLTKLFGRV